MILIGLNLKHNFQVQVTVIAQIGSGDERKTNDLRIPINMRKSELILAQSKHRLSLPIFSYKRRGLGHERKITKSRAKRRLEKFH